MSLNPLDIYARATRRLKLTPGERAALKVVDTLLVASLAGALLAVAQAALSGGVPLSFATLAQIGEYAFVTALLTGVVKLFRASGDSAFVTLGNAIEGVTSRLPGAPAPQPMSGSGPSSGPDVRAFAQGFSAFRSRPGASFPPLMPDSRAERLDALRGATTGPARAVSAASSAPRTSVPATPASSPVSPAQDAPAPSQPQIQQSAPADEDNGPPTVEMPAVRADKQDAFLR